MTILIAKWMRHLRNIFLGARCSGPDRFLPSSAVKLPLEMGHGFVVSAVAGVLTGYRAVSCDILCNDVSLWSSAVNCMPVFLFVAVIFYWGCIQLGLSPSS